MNGDDLTDDDLEQSDHRDHNHADGHDPDGDPDRLYKSTVAKISLTHNRKVNYCNHTGCFPSETFNNVQYTYHTHYKHERDVHAQRGAPRLKSMSILW